MKKESLLYGEFVVGDFLLCVCFQRVEMGAYADDEFGHCN